MQQHKLLSTRLCNCFISLDKFMTMRLRVKFVSEEENRGEREGSGGGNEFERPRGEEFCLGIEQKLSHGIKEYGKSFNLRTEKHAPFDF